MRLKIGIVPHHPGWETLLRQEGVAWATISSPGEIRVEEYSAIIVAAPGNGTWREGIGRYVKSGGAVLTSMDVQQWLFGEGGKRRFLRYLLPDRSAAGRGVGVIDVYRRGRIPRAGTMMRTDSGEGAILQRESGSGVVVATPVDLGETVLDTRSRWKSFYALGKRAPGEHVSLVSKGEVRLLFHNVLEWLHHQRGIPYAHLHYHPDKAENVFALRIDTDFGEPEEIDQLDRFAADLGLRLTWFLHAQHHEQWLDRFADMTSHEIGVHCYEHFALKTYRGTLADIGRARRAFETSGLHAVGFAGPYGVWTPEQAKAVDETGFTYASEFTFDYDNLPSFPYLDGEWSTVVQVPVHPICIGSFRRSHGDEKTMLDYFQRVIDRKKATGEPLFFYHHPKDGHLDVLQEIVRQASSGNVRRLVMGEFAAWWKERLHTHFTADFLGGKLTMGGTGTPRAAIRVTMAGNETLLPLTADVDVKTIEWSAMKVPPPVPEDIGRIRAFSARRCFDAIQTWSRRKSR